MNSDHRWNGWRAHRPRRGESSSTRTPHSSPATNPSTGYPRAACRRNSSGSGTSRVRHSRFASISPIHPKTAAPATATSSARPIRPRPVALAATMGKGLSEGGRVIGGQHS
ncbi:MAG: hypothetical protein ACYS0J_17615 [Planctomycetota bacterium]|jgi:hypothetical protein